MNRTLSAAFTVILFNTGVFGGSIVSHQLDEDGPSPNQPDRPQRDKPNLGVLLFVVAVIAAAVLHIAANLKVFD